MKAMNSQRRSAKDLSAVLLTAAMAACSSGYQAPIEDRSSRLDRQAPIIVVDGQTVSGSQVASTAATVSTPASPVGATDTVVRPVAVNTGITRAVTRSSLPPADSEPVPAEPAGSGAHTVTLGETLYSIAFAYNMDVRSLALANNLNPPYTIYPGQRLSLSSSGVSEAAISAVPQIPAAPAGEAAPATGQRPQASVEARRTGSIPTRTLDGVSWQWPADGRLLSTFSETGPARGIDISGVQGQAVYAAADGDVVYAGRGIQGAGNLVILRHSARYLSAYMYNSNMLVKEGDNVRAGDKIAEVGTGPNGRELLHFEVRMDGKPVDPVRYLPNR
jgi:lipoprotein NlpD